METDSETPYTSQDWRLRAWMLPEFRRVGLQARALWLLMAMQPDLNRPMSMPEIGKLADLDKLETGMLIAELIVAHLVEMHGHVVLNPLFTVIPRPDMAAPAQQVTTYPAATQRPTTLH